MSTGYGVYKERCISEILSSGTFDPERLGSRYGVGLDERVVESPWLFSRLPSEPGRLLDAGSVLNFEGLLMQPALRAKRIFISTLAPEARSQRTRSNVSYVYEDLLETCYRDGYFDWVVFISTLRSERVEPGRLRPGRHRASPRAETRRHSVSERALRHHRNYGWHQAARRHDPDYAAAARPVVCLELLKPT
jgi:hypothetical protein